MTLAIAVLFCLSPGVRVLSAEGHAPLDAGDNESLPLATAISDPTKSWAIYTTLHEGGEAQYYKFDISKGDRIHLMLFKSTRQQDAAFVPSLVIMGPGLPGLGTVPSYVDVPHGAGSQVLTGEARWSPTYEAFAPSTFIPITEASMDAPASGTYYLAVFEPSIGGNYGLAVGDREFFTLSEWVLNPFSLITVYQWEGQSLLLVLTPMLVTIAIGLAIISFTRKMAPPQGLHGWAAAFSGLSFIGTGASTTFQMLYSLLKSEAGPGIAITLIWVLIPIVLGILALRWSMKPARTNGFRGRLHIGIIGVLALFSWAGLIVGPVTAFFAATPLSRHAVSPRCTFTRGPP